MSDIEVFPTGVLFAIACRVRPRALQHLNPDDVDLPPWLTDIARQICQRMREVQLPEVVGHGDWETQHLRWRDGRPIVVHDWDSLSLRSEAGLVGAAAATFASDGQPTLAPLASFERFLERYQTKRGRAVDDQEVSVAWAAGL